MRAIIEIFLAIIFLVVVGVSGVNHFSMTIKRESILKVQKGLDPLEGFTKKLTNK